MPSVRALRAAGHDVAAVREDGPGSTDATVLERARAEGRVLLTFDRDFGELVYRHEAPAPPGVIYLRFAPAAPREPADVLAALATQPEVAFEGYFTVLDRDRVRQRKLPPSGAAP